MAEKVVEAVKDNAEVEEEEEEVVYKEEDYNNAPGIFPPFTIQYEYHYLYLLLIKFIFGVCSNLLMNQNYHSYTLVISVLMLTLNAAVPVQLGEVVLNKMGGYEFYEKVLKKPKLIVAPMVRSLISFILCCINTINIRLTRVSSLSVCSVVVMVQKCATLQCFIGIR